MAIHDTIITRALMRRLALLVFKFTGWTPVGDKPDLPQYVVVAAPHTSNWDFIYALCLAFIYRLDPFMMMKDAWFRWPLGPFPAGWGCCPPIDRTRTIGWPSQLKNFVSATA